MSIGAACVEPISGRSHHGFIQLADEALYAAKEQGRNCAVIMDKKTRGSRPARFAIPPAFECASAAKAMSKSQYALNATA